jgi:hypothetical protein
MLKEKLQNDDLVAVFYPNEVGWEIRFMHAERSGDNLPKLYTIPEAAFLAEKPMHYFYGVHMHFTTGSLIGQLNCKPIKHFMGEWPLHNALTGVRLINAAVAKVSGVRSTEALDWAEVIFGTLRWINVKYIAVENGGFHVPNDHDTGDPYNEHIEFGMRQMYSARIFEASYLNVQAILQHDFQMRTASDGVASVGGKA